MTTIEIERVEEVKGWPLTVARGQERPLIRDEELGRKLGFERPRDVRKLIARIFRDSELCATVAQSRGRPSKTYFLTRSQALKVTMRSETPTADVIQDEIVHVYEAWLDGRRPEPAPRVDFRTQVLAMLADPVFISQARALLTGPAPETELAGLAQMMRDAAERRGVPFELVHGSIRKELKVGTYRQLRSDQLARACSIVSVYLAGPSEKDVEEAHARGIVEAILDPAKFRKLTSKTSN